jgi:hypothetical protein
VRRRRGSRAAGLSQGMPEMCTWRGICGPNRCAVCCGPQEVRGRR